MSSESNPFKAPVARVYDQIESSAAHFLPQGRRVPAGDGRRWLLRGWELFRTAPGTWIGIAVTLMAIIVVVSLIPFLNIAVNLLTPVFIAGISIGCRAIEDGEGIRYQHLFAGFSRQLGGLLLVGLLYMVAMLISVAGFGIIVAIGTAAGSSSAWPALIIASLLLTLVLVPLGVAVWLAPPLVVFHEFSPFQAIKVSFGVSLRNFAPFFFYSLWLVLAAIVASLPLFLGWLLLLPVLYASLYACYRDLFFDE